MSTAYGAVIAWISTPPMPGPAICATDSLACSFELPSTSARRSTSAGR